MRGLRGCGGGSPSGASGELRGGSNRCWGGGKGRSGGYLQGDLRTHTPHTPHLPQARSPRRLLPPPPPERTFPLASPGQAGPGAALGAPSPGLRGRCLRTVPPHGAGSLARLPCLMEGGIFFFPLFQTSSRLSVKYWFFLPPPPPLLFLTMAPEPHLYLVKENQFSAGLIKINQSNYLILIDL